MANEKKASGGGGDKLDERGQWLKEVIEEDVRRQMADEIGKRQAEKELAQDMRAEALERFSETRKRKEEGDGNNATEEEK